MKSIGETLKELSDAASFTVTDMATWCECGRSALREWITHGITPHPVKTKQLTIRIEALRWALKHAPQLPVPISVKQQDRASYVKEVRDYALKEFSKRGTSKRRG